MSNMKNEQKILPEFKRFTPQIYAYGDTHFPGQLKIGDTSREDVNVRIEEQHPIITPGRTYRLEWFDTAFYADGSGNYFTTTQHREGEPLHFQRVTSCASVITVISCGTPTRKGTVQPMPVLT